MNKPRYTIAAVERDTGLSKDVLRVWERRYGFPTPERDANGERLYPAEQVERLRVIRRLMDRGHRPGRLLAAAPDELEALAHEPAREPTEIGMAQDLRALTDLILAHDADAYTHALQQRLARLGLRLFVQDIVAPLTEQVGIEWEHGRLQVFEEHLFTELTERVLRHAIATVPTGHGPRVLLTTVPNEQHGMGLLMLEAVLALEGAQCISLGTQVPLMDIARAAEAHRADIVALSFSAAFPLRQVPALLRELRQALPSGIRLWAGGAGTRRVAAPEGVHVIATLADAVEALI
jgi:DNA-binding transcriptional MerR regulator/methylmalonyl-CoA mutase cobalamin-binding subunit